MNTSKKSAEKGLESPEEITPKSKKPCRLDYKTVIWIDHDADEQEAIHKYLADRESSGRLNNHSRYNT